MKNPQLLPLDHRAGRRKANAGGVHLIYSDALHKVERPDSETDLLDSDTMWSDSETRRSDSET